MNLMRFVNSSGRELTVYSDSKLSIKVGMLYRDSACYCVCDALEDVVAVMYKVSSNGVHKVGFTDYVDGVQMD
ncbi:MAG: hypothetical protein FWE40_00685 [Oscillospiraceae bacterium]|nr:hypothetical protein [Oscillospiraceae bacterium]